MKTIKEREQYDSYELEESYDFESGVRGRFYEPKKIPTTLRLDNDIILYFKKTLKIFIYNLAYFKRSYSIWKK